MPHQNTIPYLIKQHIRGEITESEQRLLNEWLVAKPENRLAFEKITNPVYLNNALAVFHSYENGKERVKGIVLERIKQNGKIHRLKIGLTIAASILVILTGAIYVWFNEKKESGNIVTTGNKEKQMQPEVVPGSTKATLTLADGQKIILDSMPKGKLAQQGNTIINNTNGQLAYIVTNVALANKNISYNTLSTAKGEAYQLLLPDGSKVWLNAASSIRYPAAFYGVNRKVEITGEAYFEVAKDVSKPFKVTIIPALGITQRSAEIEVLGTHFNVNAYDDEPDIKTTLLEGSVRVTVGNEHAEITPGQQVIISTEKPAETIKAAKLLQVKADVDTSQAIAWRKGFFVFYNTDLNSVMRQIARWYDLDVEYPATLSNDKFIGKIPRNTKIAGVLRILDSTSSLHFSLEGRKIITRP